jgi:hypothetical protein
LAGGLIFLTAGHTGISFFEHNPTGKNLLGGANTVVNTTKDIGQEYSKTMHAVNNITRSKP